MRYRIWAVLAAACVLCGCGGSKPALSVAQQHTWEQFISKQLAGGTVQPNSEDATAVAAIGDAIVPYVEEQLGAAHAGPGGKGDYWLVIVLARLGTPRAIEAIEKVLRHDYPGAVGRDRETAAKALVWLGAADAAPTLEAAIADHERLIREKGRPGQDSDEVNVLKDYLEQLQQGTGKRDTATFPFDS
ncbi:MAG: HEAT repeat domain-containing protein [Candidatus Hydrogenedentes bacterium]|nr:HEAT repeat domain-containing protein [Candidatus Hydrogenedentota bacterium]